MLILIFLFKSKMSNSIRPPGLGVHRIPRPAISEDGFLQTPEPGGSAELLGFLDNVQEIGQ
jgi:hypothetical protein